MEEIQPSGVFESDSDAPPEDILVQHDQYIVALVEKMARGSSNVGRPEVLDLEIDELKEQVRVKFWNALQSRHIEHPRAYIRMIVLNEFRDLARKRKPALPLQVDEDGELYMGGMIAVESEGTANPEETFIAGENFREMLEFLLSLLREMPPRQRRVLACRLYDALGECLDVLEAFRRFSIDSDTYLWPEDEADKKLLQASHSAARQNLRTKIDHMLERCQQMRVPEKIQARIRIG